MPIPIMSSYSVRLMVRKWLVFTIFVPFAKEFTVILTFMRMMSSMLVNRLEGERSKLLFRVPLS